MWFLLHFFCKFKFDLLCHIFADLQRNRLSIVQMEYKEELDVFKKEFDSERSTIIEQHKQEMNDLQDILFAMEENANEREAEARQEFQSLRDEIKNKVSNIWIELNFSSINTRNNRLLTIGGSPSLCGVQVGKL